VADENPETIKVYLTPSKYLDSEARYLRAKLTNNKMGDNQPILEVFHDISNDNDSLALEVFCNRIFIGYVKKMGSEVDIDVFCFSGKKLNDGLRIEWRSGEFWLSKKEIAETVFSGHCISTKKDDHVYRARLKALIKRHLNEPVMISVISRHCYFEQSILNRFEDKLNVTTLSRNKCQPLSLEFLDRNSNLLDKRDWIALSKSEALPWSHELIENFKNKWDWRVLSENESLPWSLDLLVRFEDLWFWNPDHKEGSPTHSEGLPTNRALPWSIELLECFRDNWDWVALSKNENLPWSPYFIDHFSSEWHRSELSSNNGLPWKRCDLLAQYEEKRWNWEDLSKNESLPWSLELLERFEHRWNWSYLSGNRSLPWSLNLLERFEHRWDWGRLSGNQSLPWSLKLIDHYIDKWDWGFSGLSCIEELPWSLSLLERFESNWRWGTLSENKGLPWSTELLEYFENKWDWERLSRNKSLPWSIELLEYFEDRWKWNDWRGLSYNSALPWSITLLARFEDKWSYTESFSVGSNTEVPPSIMDLLERFENKIDWWPRTGWFKELVKLLKPNDIVELMELAPNQKTEELW